MRAGPPGREQLHAGKRGIDPRPVVANFGFTGLIDVVAILSGPVLGVLILLLTSQSLTFINIIGSVIAHDAASFTVDALACYVTMLAATSPKLHSSAAELLADLGAGPDRVRDQLTRTLRAEAPELAERLNGRPRLARLRMRSR